MKKLKFYYYWVTCQIAWHSPSWFFPETMMDYCYKHSHKADL